MAKQVIRVGPAGWSYKDWEGIVYPEKPGKKFDPLEYLAGFFNTIEINSSFYRPPAVSTTKSWVQRVSQNRKFSFSAKLNRVFTHERGKATAKDERDFRKGFDVLAGAGKLGALLLQFPWSFKNTLENRQYLAGLFMRFAEFPLVTEVRHGSWNQASGLSFFADHIVGFCNIDQPVIGRSLAPSANVTGPVGYVRLHGRNYETWFAQSGGVEMRYDYLYNDHELNEWQKRIRKVAASSHETYVILNNHYQGKAVVNALQIRAKMERRRVAVPENLASFYPQLHEIAQRPETLPLETAEPFTLI